jgi:hypothetical protein
MVLMKISGPKKGTKKQGSGGDQIIRSFMIYTDLLMLTGRSSR